MRFSRLRRSRLMMMLVATAWLPYMMVCCVVAPFEDSTSSRPNCHILASVLPGEAEAHTHSGHSGHHGGHHDAASHHGDSEKSHNPPPAQTCCELTGKANVTLEKSIDFGAEPTMVAVALVVSEPTLSERPVRTLELSDIREHGPPLYVKNASFLI